MDTASKFEAIRQKLKDQISTPVSQATPSPVLEHYRNNQLYTFGLNEKGEEDVGLFIRSRSRIVRPVETDSIGSILAQTVSRCTSDWMNARKVISFRKESMTGSLRHICVKENQWNDAMIIIQMFYSDQSKKDELVYILNDYATDMAEEFSVASIYVQFTDTLYEARNTDPYDLVYYKHDLIEPLDVFDFRRSPGSFFQPNMYTVPILYNMVRDMLTSNEQSPYLLDICCGTGTIGIYCSSEYEKIIGLDCSVPAIRDAKENAKLNKISHKTEHLVGNAEDIMPDIAKKYETDVIDAVVNPPRRGLYPPVITAINSCKGLSTLIYVSCNIDSLLRDLKELNYTKVLDIKLLDQFPNTDHCEVIISLSFKPLHFHCKHQTETVTGLRPRQEDRFLNRVTDTGNFYGVFDGTVGDFASEYVMEHIWENFDSTTEDVDKAMKTMYSETDRKLLLECDRLRINYAASTSVTCYLRGNTLTVGYLADSRALLIYEDSYVELNGIHKPDMPEELERIKSMDGSLTYLHGGKPFIRGGDFHRRTDRPMQLNYSRAFGGKDLKPYGLSAVPDIKEFPISKNKTPMCMIIASDGLWDFVKDEEVARISRNQEVNPKVFIDTALIYGSADNITVTVVTF